MRERKLINKEKSRKPVIGVTMDYQEGGSFSTYPWYAVRTNYMDVLVDQGAIPLGLPYGPSSKINTLPGPEGHNHEEDFIDSILESIDGLVITGGSFHIPPSWYGEEPLEHLTNFKENRSYFEKNICIKARHKGIPILGICGGMQMMNVAFGGSLIQHIPTMIPSALNHQQENLRHQGVHLLHVEPDSILGRLEGSGPWMVNSSHTQSIKAIASGFRKTAWTHDGVVEAIEHTHGSWCVGVQWHPEFQVIDQEKSLFKEFIYQTQIHIKY